MWFVVPQWYHSPNTSTVYLLDFSSFHSLSPSSIATPRHTTNNIMIHRKRRQRTSDEVSCKESAIQQNVTLKGGIDAGYFRKLAQHVAMRLCVELCCEEKGCDVAFMWGKNCYGVQCFTHELCSTVPASSRKVSGLLMISHVTFHGQKGICLLMYFFLFLDF